jgi:hypothetical protein
VRSRDIFATEAQLEETLKHLFFESLMRAENVQLRNVTIISERYERIRERDSGCPERVGAIRPGMAKKKLDIGSQDGDANGHGAH